MDMVRSDTKMCKTKSTLIILTLVAIATVTEANDGATNTTLTPVTSTSGATTTGSSTSAAAHLDTALDAVPGDHGNQAEKVHPGNGTNDTHGEGEEEEKEEHEVHKIHLAAINLDHVKYPLVFSLVVIIASLSKIGFHHADFMSSKVPESCILILLGVVLGGIIYASGIVKDIHFFAPHEFFLFLLPPIILESAYSLHERTFFENLGSILIFAVVATVIACFTIGLTLIGLSKAGAMEEINCTPVQLFVFSALIVAVDPVAVLAVFQEVGVNKVLYFLVFGESLLNDGVTVVLYNVMQTYNRMDTIPADQIVMGILKFLIVCGCSVLIGVFIGLFSSFLTRFTNSVKVVEPIVVFCFAYLSYILAEMFHFSGIISIIACGLAQVQYAFCNVTNKSKMAIKFFAKVMSSTCEIIIFLFLGLKVVHPNHVWVTGFTLWTTVLCIVYRFIITYAMALLINRFDTNRTRKFTLDEMFMVSYGGLRGAVCFSLVALLDEKEFPMKNMFVTTTLFIIFFTVFVQGSTIKFLVKKLQITLAESSKEMILYQELNQHVTDHLMAGVETVVGYEGKFYLREQFEHLDNKFLRPLLVRDCTKNSEMEELSNYYEKLVMKEHYKNLQLCGVQKMPKVGSDLRAIDSSACLMDMAGEDEDKKALLRRERRLEKSLSVTSPKEVNWDVKKFREALINGRHSANLQFHDKNMVMSQRRNMVGLLRKKHRQNTRLQTMRSTMHAPGPERTLSWSEEDADLCQERTRDMKLNVHQGGVRSHTVDIPSAAGSPSKLSTQFSLEDAVFAGDAAKEKDEKGERNPLLSSASSDGKHVSFFTAISETDETEPGSVSRGSSGDETERRQFQRQDALVTEPEVTVNIQMHDLDTKNKEE